MKTKEELNALKTEVETLNKKLAELSEEELVQVVGGIEISDWNTIDPNNPGKGIHTVDEGEHVIEYIIRP